VRWNLTPPPTRQVLGRPDDKTTIRWKLVCCDLVILTYLFMMSAAITAIAYNSTVQHVKAILLR
jgi:hypothetical protein